jgi:dTDP-4-dehydrorhamnose reductase
MGSTREATRKMTAVPILITGAAGQLASDLLPRLERLGTADAVIGLSRDELDIADEAAVLASVRDLQPGLIINLAAYNLVDKAEQERDLAFRVNADGPRHLARACLAVGAKLLHVSTDHVFGSDQSRRTPYVETDESGPVSMYGQSKLAGEQAIHESGCRHLIVRTCGLYGASATRVKGNFVTTVRRLAREREELKVVNDQTCTPSWTADVAAGIVALIAADAEGTVHVTNAGQASWFDVASEIVRFEGLSTRISPITSAEYAAAAVRPAYSVLSTARFESLTGQSLPDWKTALLAFLQSLRE